MGKPNFKNMNPNSAILNGGTEKTDSAAVDRVPAQTEPVQQRDEKAKYLRLDITKYKDYIALMADYTTNSTGKYKSMTQYILDLIEADKQNNLELYEKLSRIEQMKRELM
jgi:hypothetical protein